MANYMRPRYKVNLARLHDVWSTNYAALVRLVPALRDGEVTLFTLPGMAHIDMVVVDRGPRTVVLDIRQQAPLAERAVVGGAGGEALLPDPCACHFRVRVYHDAKMAEVIACDGHRYLKPRYDYPNPGMYQRDEKYQVNCLFSDWLKSCFSYQGDMALAAVVAGPDVGQPSEPGLPLPPKLARRQ